jgi:uncharacterized protein (TIGR03086 family)
MIGIVGLDRRAVLRTIEIVAAVALDELDRQIPCAGWSLSDLLAHMTAQHRGFAAAAEGTTDDLSVWEVHPDDGNPVAAYRAAAERAMTAFAAADILDRVFWLPEILNGGPMVPAPRAISFHFVDYVVHGWDVAVSLGTSDSFDPPLVAAALKIAEGAPTGPARNAPGAAFGPALSTRLSHSTMERLLLVLGRSPRWPDLAEP